MPLKDDLTSDPLMLISGYQRRRPESFSYKIARDRKVQYERVLLLQIDLVEVIHSAAPVQNRGINNFLCGMFSYGLKKRHATLLHSTMKVRVFIMIIQSWVYLHCKKVC
jgi:hypothetical protein